PLVRAQKTPFSLDHLVRPQHDRWGYGQTECRGGLAVDDHFEFCRELHRKIARLLAAQNAIDIGGGTTIDVYRVGSVGQQAVVSCKGRLRIDRRDFVSGRRRYDQRAMRERESTRDDIAESTRGDKAASRLAPKGDDGRFDLYIAMNVRNDWHD